ncbi:hypothetical protein Tco_0946867 [Tanacetum coccineum]
MEEYVQYEMEKALRNNQVYNWETAKYGKIWYIEDINYLRFFETKFPAIVYDDALKSELEFSSEPTLSSQHVDKVNWKNKTSLSEYDDEEYNVISKRKDLKKRFSKKEKFNILSIDKDLFSYDIFSVNGLKFDKDNDEYKIDIKQCSDNLRFRKDRPVIRITVLACSHYWNVSKQTARSHKSPTAVLFDVDTRRISIRQCEMLRSTTLNVLARSQG